MATLLVLILTIAAPGAAAQDAVRAGPAEAGAESPRQREGREHFERGVEAAQNDDWESAREAFGRAADLTGRAPVLLNLARAEAETGRYIDAARTYGVFLARVERGDAEAGRYAHLARAGLEQVLADTPRIVVSITALAVGDVLTIDGEPARTDQDEHLVDAGVHDVVLTRGGGASQRRAVISAEGEVRTVAFDAPPAPASIADDGARESPSIWARPWLWLGVGAVVAIGVVIAVFFATSGGQEEEEPYVGDLGPGMITIGM